MLQLYIAIHPSRLVPARPSRYTAYTAYTAIQLYSYTRYTAYSTKQPPLPQALVSARDEGGRLGWRATKALAADNEGGRAGVSQYAPVGRVLPYGHSGRTARRSAEQQRAEHQCGSHGRRAAAVTYEPLV